MGEEYRPSRKRIFLTRNRSSCAEKHFHSEASLEAVDRHDRTTRKTGCGRKPTYSPDMSPIEYVWDLVGSRLAHDLRPAASKDVLLRRIPHQHGIPFHKQAFKICLTPCDVV
ncbi:uncharacterized protein TNCV_2180061 [Trichonephila clavipes]|uniref:Uncharacterized protein n=1 Tax=Trichonephila clavipes TaxID=2585209 RepID=A0A8X6VUN5_TRICX|nr:uncharacterized protein TNCV_2180061 [Trichonephila clavipes]